MRKERELVEAASRRFALFSVTVAILVITLFPAGAGLLERMREGTWPEVSTAGLVGGLRKANAPDILLNVLLFVPFGVFAAAPGTSGTPGTPGFGSRRRRAARAALAGALLSAAVEVVQGLLPGRFPSLADIVANGLGAWLGAWLILAWAARERIGDGTVPGD
jgi:hypothetical protein